MSKKKIFVKVRIDVLKELLTSELFLEKLEANGVDNWCGYGDSTLDEDDEKFIAEQLLTYNRV